MKFLKDPLSRRTALKSSLGLLGAMAASRAAMAQSGPSCSVLTPDQPEGPFYPVHDQLDKDNDLTRVKGAAARAKGRLLYVRGVVTDEACAPVAGVLVEIWQACASGKYNHPGDENPAPLDPNFQYWGRAVTDKNGRYLFRTILPGEYPASQAWVRPPHIHFKVAKVGYRELITQLYFKGNRLNERDLILNELEPAAREAVIAELKRPTSVYEPHALVADFPIMLRSIRSGR